MHQIKGGGWLERALRWGQGAIGDRNVHRPRDQVAPPRQGFEGDAVAVVVTHGTAVGRADGVQQRCAILPVKLPINVCSPTHLRSHRKREAIHTRASFCLARDGMQRHPQWKPV